MSKIITMTVVMAPTMAIRTPAMPDMTASMPPPIAENMEPMIYFLFKFIECV